MARFTRREFCAAGAAGGLLTKCQFDEGRGGPTDAGPEPTVVPPSAGGPAVAPEPLCAPGGAPWVPEGFWDRERFPLAIQTGDPAPDGVCVGVHTDLPEVEFVVMADCRGGAQEIMTVRQPTTGGHAYRVLEQLAPDRVHWVLARAPGGERRSPAAQFRTALAPDATRVLRFGATGCIRENQPWRNMSQIARHDLDFFLFMGDAIYADYAPDAYDYDKKWAQTLSTQGFVDVGLKNAMIATWDDHEVDNNWSPELPGVEEKLPRARAAFDRSMPKRPGPSGQIWRKLRYGQAAEIFVLDCRSERRGREYISRAQMDWLKRELVASPAAFKFIMNSVPIFDFRGTPIGPFGRDDRWQGYPEQREEILSHIQGHGLSGVLWITGDIHLGAVGRVDPKGRAGENMWEVVVGPGGSPIPPGIDLLPDSRRIPVLVGQHNSVLFEADPDTQIVDLRYIGDDGDVLARTRLDLSASI